MSARPRLVEEGTPIPEAEAVVRNAHQPAHNQQHGVQVRAGHDGSIAAARSVDSHGNHLHPPLHQQYNNQQNHHQHRRGHQMHGTANGHGAVATHITIGGGGGSSGDRSSSYHQYHHQQQPHVQFHGSNATSIDHQSASEDMQLDRKSKSTGHRISSLSAAAGPGANTGGATSANNRRKRNQPTTQLHTHLVIGGGRADSSSSSTGSGQRQHHAAATTHSTGSSGTHPHRLVIGGYTGHVSAGMPMPRAAEGNIIGVERQNIPSQQQHAAHTATNAIAVPAAAPASGHSELAPDEYDYDLLGGGVPDHRFSQNADSNAYRDAAGSPYVDTSTNTADVTERMEVEDIIPLPPLVVIDGANVAYAYGKAKSAGGNAIVSSDRSDNSAHSSANASTYSRQGSSFGRSFQADARGILIACNYFMNAGCRVQVVLPAQWLQTKSQRRNDDDGSSYHGAHDSSPLASEMTPQLEVLHGLREQGLLCAAPANDDDDSYAIMLARREDARAARRRGGGQAGSKSGNGKPRSIVEEGGGFVLSNDQFRDAQGRDRTSPAPTGLGEWLEGKKKGSSRLQDRINNIPGRISYSFGDVGSFDQFGDKELDLIPNPRHPLVEQIEQGNRARELSLA